jgi:hypothetical protein
MDNLYIDSWSFFETGWEVLCYVMVDLYIDKWFWF